MSRSYRRAYAAITGTASAKDDKRLAHRGVRRKQDLALKTCVDFERFLLPHQRECPWNDPWCWRRDGPPKELIAIGGIPATSGAGATTSSSR
jgi:hypothetical protein